MELRFRTPLLLAVLLAAGLVAAGGASAAATAQNPGPRPQVVDLDGGSPLIQIRILVKAGSAHDPVGREGLAALTADALLEGGFGDAEQPVTKEELARRTRSWGAGANPSVRVSEEVTVFELTVPRDVLDTCVQTVLEPIFGAPLFLEAEVDRLRNEARTYLTGNLRYESLEMLGLQAVDNYVFEGTPYGHTVVGSVQGLSAIEVADVRGFFNAHYRPANMIVGLSTSDEAVQSAIVGALAGSGQAAGTATAPRTPQFEPAPAVVGREAVVVKVPDSGATGVHFAFPLTLDRTHPDFWPLWVANIHLGTHRDSHGVLYDGIR
jgi:zinc protease